MPSASDVRLLSGLRSASVAVPLIGFLMCLPGNAAEGAEFACAAGDVRCLVDAITTSNQNREANTIRLAAGTYSLTAANNPGSGAAGGAGLPVIIGDVTVAGVTEDATIIERTQPNTNLFRIFTVAVTGRLALDRLTVRGGDTGFVGIAGGILSQGSVTITNSTIAENSAGLAGAIQVASGTLTMRDTRVTANSVAIGGDIVSIGNRLRVPGASGEASAEISRSSISDNVVQEGGAITVFAPAIATISEVTIIRNAGIGGKGIAATGTFTASNSTIADNHFGINGGAILALADSLVVNSTIVNNNVGILGVVRLQNSIVAGHLNGDCARQMTSLGHNLIGIDRGCAILASDLIGDPRVGAFVELGRRGVGYIALLAVSRAIDGGDPTACPATDQRGLPRPIDGNGDGIRACDIGAVEFYPVVNDRLQFDAVNVSFAAPPADPDQVNPFAAGGVFLIGATFTNPGQSVCHVAFEVVTLRATTSPPTLLTGNGGVIGGEGVIVPATLLSGTRDLGALAQQQYRFNIGVGAREAITFFVNVLGEPAIAPCAP